LSRQKADEKKEKVRETGLSEHAWVIKERRGKERKKEDREKAHLSS